MICALAVRTVRPIAQLYGTRLSFEDATCSFTIDTLTCTGTVTRTLSNDEVVVWRIVLVHGEETIRFIDTRGNPSLRPGVLELMR